MKPNNKSMVRMIYYLLAGAIAIGSLTFSVGRATARNGPFEKRIKVLEMSYERWDERWKNLEKWMTRIEAKLDDGR